MSAWPRRWPVTAAAAWVLFAALATALALHGWRPYGFEQAAIDWSTGHRPSGARHSAIAVTALGTGAPPYVLALIAGAVLARGTRGDRGTPGDHGPRGDHGIRGDHGRTPRRAAALLLAPLLWLVAGQLLRQALMHGFGRPRPPSAHWATAVTGFSFPSGHSFTSAVCAGLLVLAVAHRRPPWTRAAAAVAVLYAVLVGLSRVYLGVHWPLDVAGGWLLAAGWLACGSAVLTRVDARPGDVTAPGQGTPARRADPGGPTTPARRAAPAPAVP